MHPKEIDLQPHDKVVFFLIIIFKIQIFLKLLLLFYFSGSCFESPLWKCAWNFFCYVQVINKNIIKKKQFNKINGWCKSSKISCIESKSLCESLKSSCKNPKILLLKVVKMNKTFVSCKRLFHTSQWISLYGCHCKAPGLMVGRSQDRSIYKFMWSPLQGASPNGGRSQARSN